MSNKDCIVYLVEENQKLKKENQILQEKLKQNLIKGANLMIKNLEIKDKIDFYEGLNFLPNDDYGKGFNKAFQIMQDFFIKKEEEK